MTNLDDFLDEQLNDEEFRNEWDALQPERAVAQALIDARRNTGFTQCQLSERTGISQSDISKLECGDANPSVRTLTRLAKGLGMCVSIEFTPLVNQLGKAS